jgi:hypothetical protein
MLQELYNALQSFNEAINHLQDNNNDDIYDFLWKYLSMIK